MRNQRIILHVALAFVGAALAAGWLSCSQQTVDEEPRQLVEGIDNDDVRKMLFELGQIRLRILRRGDLDYPQEFVIFEYRQRIEDAGFDLVWRDDRYVLKDLNDGKELDPFQSGAARRLGANGRFGKGEHEVRRVPGSISPAYMPHPFMSRLYRYELNGFHLVQRYRKYFYTKNIRKNDLQIKLEQLLLKEEAVAFNVSSVEDADYMGLAYLDEYESHLKGRGFIMKKERNSYVPVSLETGSPAELPPKEVFVPDALRTINSETKGTDYLAKRRVRADMHSEIDRGVLAKKTLDLYGVEIRWVNVLKQYRMVDE